MLELAEAKLDIVRANIGGVVARFFEHLVGHVDADHVGVADLPRGQKTVKAGAAAEIDHDLAGPERCDGLRIDAAQPEIGAVRHGSELGFRITHASRFIVRCRLRTATQRSRRRATACIGRGDAAVAGAHHFLHLCVVHRPTPGQACSRPQHAFAAAASGVACRIASGSQQTASLISFSLANDPSP